MSENTGFYIHIPFCVRKCPYCDFYSSSDLSLRSDFVKAFLQEMQLRSDSLTQIDTIYFGGGTPSVLEPCDIEHILSGVYKNFKIMDNCEVTMEVNPGTVKDDFFQKIRSFGVNRLNIGVQSFQDEKLGFLNRIHSAQDAEDALLKARKAGFGNIGLDIIYGLPGESRESLIYDLDAGLNFSPEHISCYMLTYEPGTSMYNQVKNGKIHPLDDDSAASLFKTASQYLEENGYLHYEISNFACDLHNRLYKRAENSSYNRHGNSSGSRFGNNSDNRPGNRSGSRFDNSSGSRFGNSSDYRSRHNRKYWNMVPYMGFGPSAHSFDKNVRFANHKDVKKYIADLEAEILPVMEREELTPDQRMVEVVMLGLRTSDGVDIRQFEAIAEKSFSTM
ncbi:MAG: radical SAM family heme chaperone HemW, partial [Thermodesulfobacteriota bacterium]|nr:radical SAM family heme chaperone HemW [Thermodesulfobacteriota bacterium]